MGIRISQQNPLTSRRAEPEMALSVSSLTSSFTHLSFSSQFSQLPNTSRSRSDFLSTSRKSRNPSLRITVTVAAPEAVPESEPEAFENVDIMSYVKSRLPGGIANQPIHGTGRRKCAIARVVLQEGDGKVFINYRDIEEYLQGNAQWIDYVKYPLMVLGYENNFDMFIKVHGGGLSGQAQAISLGVARALLKVNAAHKPALRAEGLLTRDARIVESKKTGLKKARKAPQFSKR